MQHRSLVCARKARSEERIDAIARREILIIAIMWHPSRRCAADRNVDNVHDVRAPPQRCAPHNVAAAARRCGRHIVAGFAATMHSKTVAGSAERCDGRTALWDLPQRYRRNGTIFLRTTYPVSTPQYEKPVGGCLLFRGDAARRAAARLAAEHRRVPHAASPRTPSAHLSTVV